jgi:hypothetical protein
MSSTSQWPDGSPVLRRSLDLVFRACRHTLLGGAVAFALVGALTTPPYVVVIVAPTFGVFVGSVVALINPEFPKSRSARRAAVFSGAGAALVVPCLAGIGQFGAEGTIIAAVLSLLSCVVACEWIVRDSDLSDGQGASALDVEGLQQLIQVLPTSTLLREWRSVGEHVRTGADQDLRARAVLVRTLLLEELSHRDPEGVARWLSEGDEEAPEQYLRGDSDATA